MLMRQYYLECLSQASYLVADEGTGRAIIVDPRRDPGELLAECAALGLTVEGVINTHFHADFVAGHLEVAAATGAWIGYGRRADTEYPVRRLAEGETIALGDVTLTVLETPGHTPESISIVVRERAADPVPYGVLTGDTLFVGDVGRPDLLSSVGVTAQELGGMLYRSIRRLMELPDEVRVFPGHGAGSSCGKSLSAERQSTIGAQRRDNYACAPMGEREFVALVTEGQKAAPGYFAFAAALNKRQRPLFGAAPVPTLEWADAQAARAAGATVLDARDADAFAAGHLPGAVNVPLEGRFAETAGTVLSPDTPLLLVVPPGRADEAVARLARVGFDTLRGVLGPQVPAGEWVGVPRVEAAELRAALAGEAPPRVLDVRNPGEREGGAYLPEAVHIPLAELPARLAEVPADRPLVVHCAGGYRSSVAASLLRRAGVAVPVSDLRGGYAAWAAPQPTA
ncbi:MBL fold hydrolase [Pilimelia terevasa]|uniref:MBL fold hydrolase n=1 Tax=Pilimelia terevasa TaxID=53372 RepID=A0A8J3BV52_9ACTN|nr:MBL fold metallo-hydrolase [Pilimelia terevasa]GGK43024.1 MBL fold hydrolase [Pilimelia terevasa]